jgi:hypothetical protein
MQKLGFLSLLILLTSCMVAVGGIDYRGKPTDKINVECVKSALESIPSVTHIRQDEDEHSGGASGEKIDILIYQTSGSVRDKYIEIYHPFSDLQKTRLVSHSVMFWRKSGLSDVKTEWPAVRHVNAAIVDYCHLPNNYWQDLSSEWNGKSLKEKY